jgi:hypothetical protein
MEYPHVNMTTVARRCCKSCVVCRMRTRTHARTHTHTHTHTHARTHTHTHTHNTHTHTHTHTHTRCNRTRTATAFCSAYACLDRFHQHPTMRRGCSMCGTLLGGCWVTASSYRDSAQTSAQAPCCSQRQAACRSSIQGHSTQQPA